MSNIIESHSPSIQRIRVFALTIALILITYSLAGIRLETPAKVQPLGIPFIVGRPEYIGIGLVLASLYSIFRFYYYGMLVQPSPMRARLRLLLGSRVDTSTTPKNFDEFHKQVSAEIHRYFPRIGKEQVWFEISESGNTLSLKVKVPTLVRLVARLEDFDFLAPIWVNVLALFIWGIGFFVGTR